MWHSNARRLASLVKHCIVKRETLREIAKPRYQRGLVVDARSFTGNPYEGHTLAAQIKQTPESVTSPR